MTKDVLKISLAESVRYLRAYGEEDLRGAEFLWNSPDEGEESEAPEETLPSVQPEMPVTSSIQETAQETVVLSGHDKDQRSRSLLQRLLGW